MIDIGQPAPRFTLPDTHGTPVDLADLAGAPVLLIFLPAAFTPVCTAEFAGLKRLEGPAATAGAQVVAVACDSMFAMKAWAAQEQIEVAPLGSTLVLSDFWPHGQVATSYDAFDAERGMATRTSYLLDGDGVVRWSTRSAAGVARDMDEHIRAIDALGRPA